MEENIKIINKKNPNFKSNKTLIDKCRINYNKYYYLDNQDEYESSYEVFCLKSINNYFYIIYPSIDEKLYICKCDTITMEKNIIYSMNIKSKIIKIKYFYDPISSNEYLFISKETVIEIYLIKSEKEYILITTYNKKGKIGGYSLKIDFLPINDFEIFHNKYNKKNYLITYFFYSKGCGAKYKDIEICEFQKNEMIQKKWFSFFCEWRSKFSIIYENKIEKKYFLITYFPNDKYPRLKKLEINDNLTQKYHYSDEIRLESDDIPFLFNNELSEEEEKINYIFGIFEYRGACEELLLFDSYFRLYLVDLIDAEIFPLYLRICLNYYINSIIKYNEEYFILGCEDSILIYDYINLSLISKYKLKDIKNNIISIKSLSIKEENINYIFILDRDGCIAVLY